MEPQDLCTVYLRSRGPLKWAALGQRELCSVREGLWAETAVFAALRPGEARLTMAREDRTASLLLRLPPGTNLEILRDAGGRLCWRRLPCRCSCNSRPRVRILQ